MEYLKPEPKPKKKRQRIKAFSEKRQAIERQKKQTYASIKTNFCAGCGNRNNLSRSHTIPRSQRPDLIADPRNITIMCMPFCHTFVECNRFFALANGESMVRYMLEVDRPHAINRIFKMKDIIDSEGFDVREMPEWVGEILGEIQ